MHVYLILNFVIIGKQVLKLKYTAELLELDNQYSKLQFINKMGSNLFLMYLQMSLLSLTVFRQKF